MALPLSTSIPNGYSITADSILCSYRNSSDRMVVVRARGMSSYFLERVVFPFEVMTFYCPRDCEVEVITRTPGGLEQSEWVAAEELHAGERMATSATVTLGSCSREWQFHLPRFSVSVFGGLELLALG
jgi:hypothetical protein